MFKQFLKPYEKVANKLIENPLGQAEKLATKFVENPQAQIEKAQNKFVHAPVIQVRDDVGKAIENSVNEVKNEAERQITRSISQVNLATNELEKMVEIPIGDLAKNLVDPLNSTAKGLVSNSLGPIEETAKRVVAESLVDVEKTANRLIETATINIIYALYVVQCVCWLMSLFLVFYAGNFSIFSTIKYFGLLSTFMLITLLTVIVMMKSEDDFTRNMQGLLMPSLVIFSLGFLVFIISAVIYITVFLTVFFFTSFNSVIAASLIIVTYLVMKKQYNAIAA